MKRLALVIFVFSLVSFGHAQTKRALTIFIGNYADLGGKGWKKISSVNDSALVLPALRNQGFSINNIDIVVNEQATRLGIDNAFQSLIASTKLNDIVVVHISAHGEQIQDDNNDETDALDESIVTYNAISPRWFLEDKKIDYDKEIKNYLRDDELGKYVDALRKNAGPKGEVLVIMDNCHSGSGTRDVSRIVRGGEPAILKTIPSKTTSKETNVSVDNYSDDINFAPFTVISASRADELNEEIKLNNVGYGSLSFAVSKAFGELSPTSTYQGFYTEIQSLMNLNVPKQHPVIEGNAKNKTLWRGDFKSKPLFFNIIEQEFSNEFVIDGGLTAGFTIGSTVYIYPSDTYDTTKATLIGKGKISAIKNFQATVVPEKPLNSSAYWIFTKDVLYSLPPFSVEFKDIDSTRTAFYTEALSTNTNVSSEAPVKLLVTKRNGKEVLVNKQTNYVLDTLTSATDAVKFNKLIKRYIKAESIRNYLVNEGVGMYEVELLAYDNVKKQVDTTLKITQNGITQVKAGTKVVVKIKNNNTKDIFFNILDIEPTAKLNAIMPNAKAKGKAITMEELMVKAGDTKIFEQFPVTIYPPYGDETFKIYVGTKPFDLQYLAIDEDTKGRNVNKDEAVFNYNFIITK